MSHRPIGIDLFAGVGGMSLGFEQAGFDVVAAVEVDPIHAAVHHYNFPQTKVIARSVIGLRGEEIRLAAGIGRSPVDVVFGGAPCQGFSLIGKRVLDDPRNQLVKEFHRIVSEIRPKSFVFENVKGLTVGEHKVFLEALICEFEAIGYRVRLPWRVLNAMNYGVPQSRQRLFLIGTRKGFAVPSYPDPTTFLDGDMLSSGLKKKTPTCKEALAGIPDAEKFDSLLITDECEATSMKADSDYARECRCETKGAWHKGYPRIWDSSLLTSSMRSAHSEISRKRFASTKPGDVEPISRFLKLDPNGVCNTLRAGTDSARGAFTSPRPIHYRFNRCITVREMARLHGYPDWFRFHETKWHGARQIGNSVPPPLARAVAESVLNAIGSDNEKQQLKPIALGDTALLRMGMSEAARYWNVPVTIGGRDRKSGVRKPKQSEVELRRYA